MSGKLHSANAKNIIITHARCADGLASAYIVAMSLGFNDYKVIEFNFDDEIGNIDCENLFVVDLSFPKHLLDEIGGSKSTIMIDHHKSAIEKHGYECGVNGCFHQKGGFFTSIVRMENCATSLVYDRFQKEIRNYIEECIHSQLLQQATILNLERFVYLIDDRDCWKKQNDLTEANHLLMTELGLTHQPIELKFNVLNELIFSSQKFNLELEKQQSKIEFKQSIVQNQSKKFDLIDFNGFKVGLKNTTVFTSEMGEAIYSQEGVDFAMLYNVTKDLVYVSLRGKDKVDLSKLAVSYGGGGHFNASGFSMKPEEFFKLVKFI